MLTGILVLSLKRSQYSACGSHLNNSEHQDPRHQGGQFSWEALVHAFGQKAEHASLGPLWISGSFWLCAPSSVQGTLESPGLNLGLRYADLLSAYGDISLAPIHIFLFL